MKGVIDLVDKAVVLSSAVFLFVLQANSLIESVFPIAAITGHHWADTVGDTCGLIPMLYTKRSLNS